MRVLPLWSNFQGGRLNLLSELACGFPIYMKLGKLGLSKSGSAKMNSKVKLPSNSKFLHDYLPDPTFSISLPEPSGKMLKILQGLETNRFKSEASLKLQIYIE